MNMNQHLRQFLPLVLLPLMAMQGVCQDDNGVRGFTISLGTCYDAFIVLNGEAVREELRLTDDEKQRAGQLMHSLFQSDDWRSIGEMVGEQRTSTWDAAAYCKDVLLNNSHPVHSSNERILADVRELLGDKRFARFRQLHTQAMVNDGIFDSVILLNNIKVKPEEYAELHRFAAEKRKHRPERDTAEWTRKSRYHAAVRRLITPRIDAAAIEEKLGEETESVFRLPSSTGDDEDRFGLKISLAFLTSNPGVQQELGMTVKQAIDANNYLKQAVTERKRTSHLLETLESDSKKNQTIKAFNRKIRNDIEDIFNSDQLPAFKRSACQYLLAQGDIKSALQLVGIDAEIDEEWCLICDEAQYRTFVDEFRLGIEILQELVGQRAVKRLCGNIVMPASAYSVSGGAEYLKTERELRKEISDELLTNLSKKIPNPRR